MTNDLELTVTLNDRATRQLKNMDKAAKGLTNTLRTVGGALAAIATGAIARSITEQYTAFEKYRTVLTTFLGSQKRANAELKRLQGLANNLPQDLQDITQAFTILTRNGLNTSSESLKNWSNIATANGKSITQLAEAVADGMTGEFERFKEFGIKVSKEGDKLVANIGSDQVAIATSTTELIRQLEQLGGTRFGGAAASNADTLNQAFSNLNGAFFTTSVTLMENLSPALKQVINDMTGMINRNQDLVAALGVGLGDAVRGTATAVKFLADNFELLRNAFLAVAVVRLTNAMANLSAKLSSATAGANSADGALRGMMTRLKNMLSPAKKLAGSLLFFIPGGWLAKGLVVAAGAVGYFEDALVNVGNTSVTVGEVISGLWNMAGQGVEIAANYITQTWDKVVTWFQENMPAVPGFFRDAFDNVSKYVKQYNNFILAVFTETISFIGRLITNIPEFFVQSLKRAEEVIVSFSNSAMKNFGRTVRAGVAIAKGDFYEAYKILGEEATQGFADAWQAGAAVDIPDLIPEFNPDFDKDYVGAIFTGVAEGATAAGEAITGVVVPAWQAFESTLEGTILKQREINRIIELANTQYDDHAVRMLRVAGATAEATVAKTALNEQTGKELSFLEQIAEAEETKLKNILAIQNALAGENNMVQKLASTYQLTEAQIRNALNERLATMVEVEEKSKELNDNSIDYMKNFSDTVESNFKQLGGTIKSNLFDVVNGTKSMFEGLRDIAKSIIGQILDAFIQVFIVQPLITSLFGGFTGGLGFLGGAFADGGRVNNSSKPIIVGEKGPEIFMPNGAGQVIPNDELGSMGGGGDQLTVNFNINAVDTQTGTEFIVKNRKVIEGVVQSAYNKRGKPGPRG